MRTNGRGDIFWKKKITGEWNISYSPRFFVNQVEYIGGYRNLFGQIEKFETSKSRKISKRMQQSFGFVCDNVVNFP